jgi:cobalamin biosynthesis Mg chelatase CobN
VLALLAFVALPGFASAGEIPQYEVEEPGSFEVTHPTKESPKPKHNGTGNTGTTTEPKAHASENTSGGKSSSGEKEPEEQTEKEKSQSAGGAPSNNGGGGGGGESSKPTNNGGGSKDGIGGSQEVAGGGTGTPVAHKTETSSGGGSSPVVPILIAVIVLAAISIGVVLYRQRKSGGQGPDRRVSSPNAS